MLDALLLQQLRQPLRLFDRHGSDQHRLTALGKLGDLVGGGEVFFFLGAVDDVGILDAQQPLVGRNDDDFQPVDFVELGRFGLGRTGHAGQLFVHAEVVLEGDGREGLVLALDLDVLFGFDRLVQAVGPAASWHEAAGELVDDEDLAVLHDVFDIAPVERMCFEAGLDVVLQVPVFRIGDVADAEQLLDFFPAGIGDGDGAVLLVDHEIAGEDFVFAQAAIDLLAQLQRRDDAVDLVILVGGLFALAADDKWGAGLVDEDGIDFVDDAEVMTTLLHAIVQVELHVVAQVVKAVFVVGAVGDVGAVSLAPLLIVEIVDDDADGQAKEGVELAHPLRVALGEVIVDGDDVDAASRERVEIDRQGGDQRLTFTGLHLGDLALVEHDAADELHVEVPHVQYAPAAFADDGESLGQNLIERGLQGRVFFVSIFDGIDALANALAKFVGLGAELLVGELLHGRLERVDLVDERRYALDLAFVTGAKNGGDYFIEQCGVP